MIHVPNDIHYFYREQRACVPKELHVSHVTWIRFYYCSRYGFLRIKVLLRNFLITQTHRPPRERVIAHLDSGGAGRSRVKQEILNHTTPIFTSEPSLSKPYYP